VTPDQITALFTALTLLITAVGGVIVKLYALSRQADKADEKSSRIEANTNGAVSAAAKIRKELETRIGGLEERLREVITEGKEDKALAAQSASDVQSALASSEKGRAETTEPGPPEEGS
jgi:hypothetical protein